MCVRAYVDFLSYLDVICAKVIQEGHLCMSVLIIAACLHLFLHKHRTRCDLTRSVGGLF